MKPSPATDQTLSARLSGVPSSAVGYALSRLVRGEFPPLPAPQTLLHIATNDRAMEAAHASLAFFAPDIELLTFPAWDTMPYDRASPRPSIMAERMRTLAALATPGKRIVLTTANAALQKLPPRELMRRVVFSIRKDEKLNMDALSSYLAEQGYRRAGKAMEPGEFALRGGIIDIIPSGASEGIRIDLFGDEIESMKRFDPLTQISSEPASELTLYPMSEVLLNEQSIARFRESYRELFGAVNKEDPLYEAISQGASFPGMEHFLPLFYERTETLADYCEGALLTLDSEAETAIEERQESIRDYFDARKNADATSKKNSFGASAPYHPIPPERAFLMPSEWQRTREQNHALTISPFEGSGIAANLRPALRLIQGQPDRTPFDQLRDIDHKPILLACYSGGSRERLQTMLSERGFHPFSLSREAGEGRGEGKSIRTNPLPNPLPQAGEGTIMLAVLPLENGFGGIL